jgi:hypothetical protein
MGMKQRFRDEYVGADLGDSRRNDRLVGLGEALAKCPAASFPDALGGGAQLEAAYRFLSNPAVKAHSVLEPHHRETALRCAKHATVVVAHDTTDFVFAGENRQGLGRMRGHKERGFFSHAGLAVTRDGLAEPLGVLNLESWTRQGPKANPSTARSRKRQLGTDRESTRWLRGVDAVEARLGHRVAIHVMDREADAYELFASLVANDRRFVIRSSHDRRLADGGKLLDYVESQAVVVTREVAIARRRQASFPKQRKIYPPRNGRIATLGLKAASVTLRRPQDLPSHISKSLRLHVVIVEEVDPPQDEARISWRLYTTDPITTVSDIESVVDAYRCRWRIEEFFKVIKTGCAMQKRQLETGDGLMNALAVFTPIAPAVLRHRTLAHADGNRPASQIMTSLQLRILNRKSPRKIPPSPSVADALVAVAALGGHLKRNGPPGWITLWRGYQRLLVLEEGAILAAEM